MRAWLVVLALALASCAAAKPPPATLNRGDCAPTLPWGDDYHGTTPGYPQSDMCRSA